jgi:protein-tyrosine phosphatase
MAEALLKKCLREAGITGVRVDSCGLAAAEGQPVSAYAMLALRRLGVKNFRHKARRLSADDLRKYDVFICMTRAHALNLRAAGGGENVTAIADITNGNDVDDPWGGSADSYYKTAQHLNYAMDDIIEKYVKR